MPILLKHSISSAPELSTRFGHPLFSMCKATKCLSPGQNLPLTSRLLFQAAYLTVPFRCLIDFKFIMLKNEILLFCQSCPTCFLSHLIWWHFSGAQVLTGYMRGCTLFSCAYIQFSRKSCHPYLQLMYKIHYFSPFSRRLWNQVIVISSWNTEIASFSCLYFYALYSLNLEARVFNV